MTPERGVAQFGSAFGWGPKGRWFKSSRPDLVKLAPRRSAWVSQRAGFTRKPFFEPLPRKNVPVVTCIRHGRGSMPVKSLSRNIVN